MAFFIPFNLCHTFSSITSLVFFTKYSKLWDEKKKNKILVYKAASVYQVISKTSCVFRYHRILGTYISVNNPY